MSKKHSNWKIIREANDPLALRLSIGSPSGSQFSIEDDGYIVYRGDTRVCIELLLRHSVFSII